MDGSWVDEGSPMDPVEQSGMVVRDAERLLLEKRPDAIILRFAGMYGPNRLLRKQAILAGEPLVGDAERWLNLIQIDDGAEAVLQAELRAKPGDTYNIADNAPPKRRQFYTRLAELLAAPVAQFEQRAEAGQANRRVSNAKAQSQLNWLPRYPSYQTGLVAAVEGSEEAN
jgi:nucleoside-diphosphate-sugar epimerase